MMYSAQVSMGDDYDPEEEETAFEKWVGDHFGKKAEEALLAGGELLALFVEGVLLPHLALVETHLGLDALLLGLVLRQGLAAGGADGLLGVP